MKTGSRSTPCVLSVLLAVFLLASASPGLGVEALNYRYQLDEDKTLNYWYSPEGLRMDYREGESEYSVIQPSNEDTILTVTHADKTAVKLNRDFLRRMINRMERMRKKLEQLPPRQRKMMEKSMGDVMKSLEESDVSPPRVVNKSPTKWKNRPAVRGDVTAGEGTIGSVTLLNEAPLAPREEELRSIRSFQSIMKDLLSVVGSVAESTGVEQLGANQSFHLLGKRQLRLAEFQSDEATIRLVEWDRRDVGNGFFSVPDGYTIRDPSQSAVPPSDRDRP